MNQAAIYVGAVVRKDGEILLVRQAEGHPLEGQWTVPWGALESGESPMSGALREAWEEGGVEAKIEGLIGIQELPEPLSGSVAIIYMCRHVGGTPLPKDRETDAAAYYTPADLDSLTEPVEPWSNWLIRRVFAGEIAVKLADRTNPLQVHGAFL